jgi:alpha-tubulin suppressor-like RCC1 family protein
MWKKLLFALCAMTAIIAMQSGMASAQTRSVPASGSLLRWGAYLGEEKSTTFKPTSVGELSEVVAIDASNASSYALTAGGTVWAWGPNQNGELGDGNTLPVTGPVQVAIPSSAHIVAIGEAGDKGLAVDSEGNGWAWGEDTAGSDCVAPTRAAITTPVEIPGLHAVSVQGADSHSLWLTEEGKVLVCGSNQDGQLGLGESVNEVSNPTEVPGLANVVEVTAGCVISAVRTASGEVYAWGNNKYGAAGTGSKAAVVYTPHHVSLPEAAIEISAGGDTVKNGSIYALTKADLLYGWGLNEDGEIPGSTAETVSTPVNTGLHFSEVVAGGTFGLGLDSEGNVWEWGSSDAGAKRGMSRTPVVISRGVRQISGTAENALALH